VRLWLTVVVGFDWGSPQACGTPTRNPSGLAASRVKREKGAREEVSGYLYPRFLKEGARVWAPIDSWKSSRAWGKERGQRREMTRGLGRSEEEEF
jgi:hypothetical protein